MCCVGDRVGEGPPPSICCCHSVDIWVCVRLCVCMCVCVCIKLIRIIFFALIFKRVRFKFIYTGLATGLCVQVVCVTGCVYIN